MNPPEAARSYYAAIDEDRYDDLADLLAAEFVHQRPDRTFEGRETFVAFMRDDRPRTDTTHELDGVYVAENENDPTRGGEVAVRGRLLDADDDRLFAFVDVHTVEIGSVVRIRTYTD
ncbi:nuclear transport factor 2 family protein [Halococcus agarilyticus]|uniref:nuclear transport factor 2 family protein n=1 Tax=Halococcus agarilyticus TaxID=1232219 RepID=UPI000677BEBE|nr:nuclear transport factor 2 family protein [Halococcus agarilyticus]